MTAASIPLLEAQDWAKGDVSPTSATVHVTLTSDKFFSGNAAFSQAEELRKLAEALHGRGLPQGALTLEGASLDVSSGVFSKSSSVTYRVLVLVEDLDLLGSVLDVVSEAKKASLTRLAWNYDDSLAEHLLLRKAGERAAAKARVLAEAVGAKLGAIHSIREERSAEPRRDEVVFGVAPLMARARAGGSIAEELGGLELAPKKSVTVRVVVAYVLAPS